MAYQQDFTDKDKEAQAGQGQVLTASGPSTVGAPASGVAPSSAPTTPKKGSGFTNLSQYVKANEDQAYNKMVPAITSDLRNRLGSVQTAKNDFWNTIASDVGKNTIQDRGLNAALRSDPEAAKADQWKEAYTKQSGGYQGPKTVSDVAGYQGLNQDIANLNTDIQGLREPGRIQARLQDVYGKTAPYTQGQSILDSYITTTGAGAEGLGLFQNQYAEQNLPKNWEDLKISGNQALKNAALLSSQTQKDTEAALAEGIANKKAREAAAAKEAAIKQAAPVIMAPQVPPSVQPAKEIPKALPNIKTFTPIPGTPISPLSQQLLDTRDLRNILSAG